MRGRTSFNTVKLSYSSPRCSQIAQLLKCKSLTRPCQEENYAQSGTHTGQCQQISGQGQAKVPVRQQLASKSGRVDMIIRYNSNLDWVSHRRRTIVHLLAGLACASTPRHAVNVVVEVPLHRRSRRWAELVEGL